MPVTTTISPSITVQGYRRNGIGYMTSPDGSKIRFIPPEEFRRTKFQMAVFAKLRQ